MSSAKLELPDLPSRDAGPQAHLDFANQALKRTDNRIARVRKLGHAAPLLVLVFENSDELALTAPQHAYGAGLIDQLASYDGQLPPNYTKPQTRQIYASLIRASDLWDSDSWHDELLLDLNALLNRWLMDNPPMRRPNIGESLETALYSAVSDFQTVNKGRTGNLGDPPPILMFWDQPADYNQHVTTELWIPRGAVVAYLRAVRNPTVGALLKNTLMWFGWHQEDPQVRNKADWRRRVHAHVWVVPVPWAGSETDLQELANRNAGNRNRVPTSPGGTSSTTRAREPSRARVEGGDVRGRGDAPNLENGAGA
jgi:hypothetical protein